jgi:serine/threonine protein kinase
MSADGLLALPPGASFHGRYRIVRRIKTGGMGAVYEVIDDRTNSRCALKCMLPALFEDLDLQTRFALEAKITGDIVSDHLVRVSDAGIDEPTCTPFLVMELLLGEDLGSYLRRHRPVAAEEVVLFLHQAALALDKTHAAGIVHRDLKPDNLFITYRDDGSPCIKLLDFGVAKIVAQGAAHSTRAVGTPLYMAPEQILGEAAIGPRTDLFALGHIAYTLLVGEAYWIEEQRGADSIYPVLSKIAQGLPEAPRARAHRRRGVTLPPAFDAWMARAAARRLEDRYDRATVQIAALAAALGVSGPTAPAPSLSAALRSPVAAAWPPPPPAPVSAPPQGVTGVGVVTTAATRRSRSVAPLVLGGALGAMAVLILVLALGLRLGASRVSASAPATGDTVTSTAPTLTGAQERPSTAPTLTPTPVASTPSAPPIPSAEPAEPMATTVAAAPLPSATARVQARARGPAANPARPVPKPTPLADGPGF